MSAQPKAGKIFIDPTSALVGGTALTGILEERVEFEANRNTQAYGGGLEADNWVLVNAPGDKPPALIIPVRDSDGPGMQHLLGILNQAEHADPATVAIVIRNRAGDAAYLYGPRWARHPDCTARIVWARDRLHLDGAELMLAPQRDGEKRAYMLDDAEAINEHYFPEAAELPGELSITEI